MNKIQKNNGFTPPPTFKKKLVGGFTLVEALIYIGTFVLLSAIIVSLIFSVLETNKYVSPLNAVSRSAVSILEIMTKEIRGAKSVDITNGLQLSSTDDEGGQRLLHFYLSSGQVLLAENGLTLGPLSASGVTVNNLLFNLATSTPEDLLKIELQLSAGNGPYERNETFYTSIKLRTDN